MARSIHIVGAGLAGLSAAVRLVDDGLNVVVHESAGHAGGRTRSYHDAALDLTIDNGNHLILSGNHATLAYLHRIGAQSRLVGPATAEFPFIDLATRERWTLRPNDGRVPWWVFAPGRRVPATRAHDYLGLLPLLWKRTGTVGECVPGRGPLHERLIHPLLVAALNTDPGEGSARLAAAVVRETLAAGGSACRPLIARDGLSPALIDPALAFLRARAATVRFGHRLRALAFEDGSVTALDFGEDVVPLAAGDGVILAVPPPVAAAIVPGLDVPSEFRAIVNAHFRITPPAGFPAMIGVVNATTEWIFSFPGRLSVTISAADRLLETGREELAYLIWREVSAIAGLASELPPWQIVRERRATFAATPAQDAKRPPAATAWSNLVLAGDWTATGLPATIEGAIRSGNRAAELTGKPGTTA
jgi:squalene-associated FAD-dependent desaturase